MDNFTLPEKLFFREREVIKITNLSKRVINYWITQFPFFNIETNHYGEKLFKREDILIFLKIKEIVLNEGKSIEEAREILSKEIQIEKNTKKPDKKEIYKKSGTIDLSILSEIKKGIQEILTILKKNSKT